MLLSLAGAGFKAMMEAVSYKRELILVTTAGARYLEFVFQLHGQFRRLGIAHFLAMSYNVSGILAHGHSGM